MDNTHGFLCRHHFLANVMCVSGTVLWFLLELAGGLILYRVITRERRVKKGCQGRNLRGSRVVSLCFQMCP
jgi:hypothetical protein